MGGNGYMSCNTCIKFMLDILIQEILGVASKNFTSQESGLYDCRCTSVTV